MSAYSGKYETIVRSNETIDTWRRYEHIYLIPPKMNALRFNLNILRPGTFWIDDIRIEKID